MPSYIKQLEGCKRDAHNLTLQAQGDVNELVDYLLSDKFHVDTTVQVKDVLARLQGVRSTLIDLAYFTKPGNLSRLHHWED